MGRRLRVRVGAELSSPVEVGSGVPQGSRRGPLLFLLAFDDVFKCQLPEGVKLVGYADDLVLSGSLLSAAGEKRLQWAASSGGVIEVAGSGSERVQIPGHDRGAVECGGSSPRPTLRWKF